MDANSIVPVVTEIAKYVAPMIGSVWYLSHRLTTIDAKLRENSESSVARDAANIQELKLVKSELLDQIHTVDHKVANIETKLSGEIRESHTKSAAATMASINENSINMTNVKEKITVLASQIDKYSDNIRASVDDLKERVSCVEQKVSAITGIPDISPKSRIRKRAAG
jgi:hypothetical protein